jgi:murein DD-endopeptidase MepM/ murein hydrolase activator NlpD
MEQEINKSIYKKWWFWLILGSVLVVFVVILIMPTISKKRDESADNNRYLNNSSYQSAKECIEKALGKEKAKAIKEGKEQASTEEQKIIDDCNKNFNSKTSTEAEALTTFYPDTDQAPVLNFKWDGQIDTSRVTRYSPFGIWEDWKDYPEGVAYEPAQEMQFYLNTDKDAFSAVAPGIVVNSEVDKSKNSGIGLVTVRYGKYYSVTYYHIIPDKNIKVGAKVETGDRLGTMEKRQHQEWGEETWWEIGLQRYNPETKMIRTVNPYEYFNDADKKILDAIANAAKEYSPFWKTADGKRGWVVTGGCAFTQYTGGQEWWSSMDRLGYTPNGAIDQSEKDFIKSINPNWKSGDSEGRILGPNDKCK